MAKLQSYYVLCPLIDQKSFLGLSHDKEDETVIVTLGRNVVNKYRLTDQKQIGGWTSKDHITSPVIYDKEQCSYVGVFNNNTIKIWKEDTDNLDKAKKYKFSLPILKLIPQKFLPTVIVFVNGNCAFLPYALENRKTYTCKSLFKDSEELVLTDTHAVGKKQVYICHIVKSNGCYEIIYCPLREELGDLDKSMLKRINVSRPDDVHVVGSYFNGVDKPIVYVLWSDSKMTSYHLRKNTWHTIGTLPWISTSSSVSLTWMGRHHLIAFGSNIDQDGAMIVAYNVQLGVGSCRYPMKMYTKDARLFCFDNCIFLESSNHIGMLPYVLETKRNLSSLLGTHETREDESMEIVDWGTPTTPQFQMIDEISDIFQKGLSERRLCSKVVAQFIESQNNDSDKLLKLLRNFKDVPESVIVVIINYIIKIIKPECVDVTDQVQLANFIDSYVPEFKLLEYVLGISFSDALIIPVMKNAMQLKHAVFLMAYISLLLGEGSDVNIQESRLFDWCSLLMDAFYQQYLMTTDEQVTKVLQTMQNRVIKLIGHLDYVNKTFIEMHKILYCKPSTDDASLPYCIELMKI